MRGGRLILGWGLPVALGILAMPVWANPLATVVLANRNVPESLDLAHAYMAARGIPEAHLVTLDLPATETITRWHYHHRLREPLLAHLREIGLIDQVKRLEDRVGEHDSGWRTVRADVDYLVSMYGIPLRIADTKPFSLERLSTLLASPALHNGAAVDSELAMVLFESYDLAGPFSNPLSGEFVLHTAMLPGRHVVMAARLDGPDPATVRRMMDDALHAETHGLHGRAYFDLRGIRDASLYVGDYWIWEAQERLAREGYETVVDWLPETWPITFPMERPAFYLGWYTEHVSGPFLRDDFQFARGAIAYHLHSFSAKTLRDPAQHWAGPLLARGAAATLGAIDEPYLTYTPNLKTFTEHLCLGMTFGQAAYASMSALSWHITVIGDPLYRPFAQSPEAQRARLVEARDPDQAWPMLRIANRLLRSQQFSAGVDYLRRGIVETRSPVLREKLADVLAVNQGPEPALAEFADLMREATTAETAVRVALKWRELNRALGRSEAVSESFGALRERWAGHPSLGALDTPSQAPEE